MLIKINRINPSVEEEYISDSEIISCKKTKVIDKKSYCKCHPVFIDFDIQLRLEKLKDVIIGITTYKNNETGDLYVFREYDPFFKFDEHHAETEPYPGWNKVEIVEETYHYEYWLETRGNNITGKIDKAYWRGGNDVDLHKDNNKIQVDIETYNSIINLLQ